MIRNEVVSITVGGTSIYPKSISITKGMGKGYNTCNVSGIDLAGSVNDTVVVTINSIAHSFIVDEKHYGKSGSVVFNCKGVFCKLDDLLTKGVTYNYTTSTELINDAVGALSLTTNIANIDFNNKAYSKDSTPLTRITDMVNVVGGEIYEDNGTLTLDYLKSIGISDTPTHTFADNEIFNYSYFDKRDMSSKVQSILINPVNEDLYSEAITTLDFDVAIGEGNIFFNPSLTNGATPTISGLAPTETILYNAEESISLSSATNVKTKGAIESISSIRIGSDPLVQDVDYEFVVGYNIIRFISGVKNGTLNITYKTKIIKVTSTVTTDFEILYECTINSGTITIDGFNGLSSCELEIQSPLTYENGGTVITSKDSDLEFTFVEEKGSSDAVVVGTVDLVGLGTAYISYLHSGTPWANTAFMSGITSEFVTSIRNISGEVIYDDILLEYVIYLTAPILSINDIYEGSQVLSGYTYNGAGITPYISFQASDEGRSVNMSINVQEVKITLPAPQSGHPVTFLDASICGNTRTAEFITAEATLCSLPATFDVDVANLFGLDISAVVGKTLNGAFGSKVVDNLGKINITVSTPAKHIITADSIKSGATITIDSEGM